MKKTLNIFLSTCFINITVSTMIACSPPQDRYLTIKDIQQTLDYFNGMHYKTTKEFEHDFKLSFEKEEYIFFEKNAKPINEHSLLIDNFTYKQAIEEQSSSVKDIKVTVDVYYANEFNWELRPVKINTKILVGTTQNLSDLELKTNIGEITSKNHAYDEFIELNPEISKDGIDIEERKNNNGKTELFVVGDGKYYSGEVQLQYTWNI